MTELSRARALKAVEGILERYRLIAASKKFSGFDKHVMENLKLLDATSKGTTDFELLVDESFSNINDVLHGGAAAVIFDMCTMMAMAPLSRPGYWDFMAGVTRTLNISYLKAIPVGTTIRIHSEVIQASGLIALIRGTMMSVDGKTIYSTAEQQKIRVRTRPQHLEFRVAWDDLWDKDGNEIIEPKTSKL